MRGLLKIKGKEMLSLNELLNISVAMFAGLMLTRLGNKLRLPDVTAYLVAGVLIGPCVIGALHIPGVGFSSFAELEALGAISDVALGFIAFSIGNEFRLSQLRETGRQALVIGILQALVTTLVVDAALLGLHFLFPQALSVPAAITLGAIGAATAPAATLMVVRQYKAKGKLTDLLLPIVALDDAVGLVVFAVSFGVARALSSGIVDVYTIVVNPILEILGSLFLGALAGLGLAKIEPFFHSNTNRIAMSISFVFLTVALSMLKIPAGGATIGFSPLLVCMMLGSVFCNLCPLSEEIMRVADRWTAPVLVLFFVLSGAELELGVFAKAGSVAIGLVYILSRSLGKYIGARESARLMGCDKTVVDYLGVTLLPQAGVALGMCVTAAQLPGDGSLIRNIVLFAVLNYELFGPVLTKWALTKAGDIKPKSDEVLHRRERKLAAAAERK
jgi:NhaP-type Na+/H+ or K+/H+ antiporter